MDYETRDVIDLMSIRLIDWYGKINRIEVNMSGDLIRCWALHHVIKRIENKMNLLLIWKEFRETGKYDIDKIRGKSFGEKVGELNDFLENHRKQKIRIQMIESDEDENFMRDDTTYYFFGALNLIQSLRNQLCHGFDNPEFVNNGISLLTGERRIGMEWFKPNREYWKEKNKHQYMTIRIDSRCVDTINGNPLAYPGYDAVYMAKDQVIKGASHEYYPNFLIDTTNKDEFEYIIDKIEKYAMMIDVYLFPLIAKKFTYGLTLTKNNKCEYVHISDDDELGQIKEKYSGVHGYKFTEEKKQFNWYSSCVWKDPSDPLENNIFICSRLAFGRISIYRDTLENLVENFKKVLFNGVPIGKWIEEHTDP